MSPNVVQQLNLAGKKSGHRVILASLQSETDDERNTTMAEDRMAVLEIAAQGERGR